MLNLCEAKKSSKDLRKKFQDIISAFLHIRIFLNFSEHLSKEVSTMHRFLISSYEDLPKVSFSKEVVKMRTLFWEEQSFKDLPKKFRDTVSAFLHSLSCF